MIRVLRYGDTIHVQNPANPHQTTEMVKVTFIEEGREGANYNVNETSRVLDQLIADDLIAEGLDPAEATTGLQTVRIHTQPVRKDRVHHFPIGRELEGFINRQLYSVPQLRQQQGVLPRMIDGRPTFFTTTIGQTPEDDRDERLPNSIVAQIHPEYFDGRVVSQTARVDLVERQSQAEAQRETDIVMDTVGGRLDGHSDEPVAPKGVTAASEDDFR